jgi:hypothetical protein
MARLLILLLLLPGCAVYTPVYPVYIEQPPVVIQVVPPRPHIHRHIHRWY